METEKLLNQVVMHKIFGKGIIQSVEKKYLEVCFQDKVSRFAYPACFYGFLTLLDEELQLEVQLVVDAWKEENSIVQKEELQKKYDATIDGIKERRRVAEEKKIKAAQRSMENRKGYEKRTC